MDNSLTDQEEYEMLSLEREKFNFNNSTRSSKVVSNDLTVTPPTPTLYEKYKDVTGVTSGEQKIEAFAKRDKEWMSGEKRIPKNTDWVEKTLEALQVPLGASEFAVSGIGSLVAQLPAQGAGAIAGAMSGKGVTEGAHSGAKFAEPFVYTPRSQAGQRISGLFTALMQKSSESLGEAAPKFLDAMPLFDKLSPDTQNTIKSIAHAEAVALPDMIMAVFGLKGVGKPIKDYREASSLKRAEEAKTALEQRIKDELEITRLEHEKSMFEMFNNPVQGDLFRDKSAIESKPLLAPPRGAPEVRVEGQGELFTGTSALSPAELLTNKKESQLIDRGLTLDEGGRGARDIAQPVEKLLEIGSEAESPIHTADMINGALQQAHRAIEGKDYSDMYHRTMAFEASKRNEKGGFIGKPTQENLSKSQTGVSPFSMPYKERGAIGDWPRAKREPVDYEKSLQMMDYNIRSLQDGIENVKAQHERILNQDPSIMKYLEERKINPIEAQQTLIKSLRNLEGEKESAIAYKANLEKFLSGPRAPVLPFKQRGHIGEWDRKISKQGLTTTMLEARKQLTRETRPLEEIVKSGEIDAKTIQDFGFQKLGTKLLIDKTISILAQSKTGLGKIVKRIQDERERITLTKNVNMEKSIHDLLGPWRSAGLNLASRLAHPIESIQKIRTLHSDLRNMIKTWQDKVGKETLTRQHFKNDRQWATYKKSRDVMDQIHSKVNETRQAQGLKPLDYISNYFPAIWEGDYRVWIKDQAGETVGARGFKNVFQAKLAQKFIQKEHPDFLVENPKHVKVSEDMHDLSAFEFAMRMNSKDNKAFTDLQKTYSRLMRTKGYGPHGLYRENIFGYLGTEGGNRGLKNSEKALEIWVRRAETHMANLEVSKLQRELHEQLPREVQAKIPKAMEYLDQYLSNTRGVKFGGLKTIDSIFETLGQGTGFGRSAARHVLQDVTGIGSLFKVFTAKFTAAQVFQPTIVIPKLQQLNIRYPGVGNPIYNFWKGYQGQFFPDAIQGRIVEWAGKEGHLSSAVVEMMKMRQADLTISAGNRLLDTGRWMLSQEEKYVVRIPVLLAFEHALRKVLPKELERFQVAADHLYYVTNYGHESSPLVYSQLGTIGDAARPMKQYAHNYIGQFLEHTQGAINRHEFSPLAMFYAQQLTVAGLRGSIAFAEATALVTLINTVFNANWPTPEEWLMSSGASDLAVFGLPSTRMGMDVSSSMNAPSIPQMFSFFPVAVGVDASVKVGRYLRQLATGKATDRDMMDAALAVSPNAMHGWIEELFSKPGMPVPHPGMNMQGTHVRNESEKGWATWMSLKSLDESRKDAEMRAFKQIFARDARDKTEAISVISDLVMNDKEVPDFLIEIFIEQGGNPNGLNKAIKEHIISRSLTWEDNQIRGKMTPEKLHKLHQMEKTLDLEADKQQQKEDEAKQKKETGGGFQKMSFEEVADVPVSDTNWPAKIRAQEAGNDPVKIQRKIDVIEKGLADRSQGKAQGPARDMLKRELNDWKNAQKYIQKMGYTETAQTQEPDFTGNKKFQRWFLKQTPETKRNILQTLKDRGYTDSDGTITDKWGDILFSPNPPPEARMPRVPLQQKGRDALRSSTRM